MDRRDYNNEERDVFNNDGRGGGFIPRRRFNFSRSDYQNPDNLNVNNGGYQSQYQPYSQANYQPNYQPNPAPYQAPVQQPYANPQYAPQQQYSQPYPPQQPMPNPNMAQPNMGQMPMGQGYQYQDDGIDFDGRNMGYEPVKKKGLFSFRNKKQQQYVGDMQNVLIVTPKTLSEVQDIIDNLRNRQAVIVEFNRINEKYAQRILDFLNGAIYALGGCEQRIADNMFLFTPGGVSIQGQVK